ncbi:MAG TPA: acyl-CoA dehydrogenase [Rhodospirillaceae bacterium]|nr:acyl-CoA dehydrogenase [Rhodospirillaceae bacterium]
MADYRAPLDDMRFALTEIADMAAVNALPGYGEATPDLVDAVLEEAGKFGSDVLAPLNHTGDQEGCVLENGIVRTPKGFPDAYQQFFQGGWNAIWAPEEWGGQGLPVALATAVSEVWHAANLSFALCPMLTQSGIELLLSHGSDEINAVYLEKLVTGQWTGTMNLTEPQAGSDLARIRCKAERTSGGGYAVRGQKIFISHGEHDMAENIVHMVLARSPDGPEGIKGLSLFVVPKFLPDGDGNPGARNDLRCVSLEHKMGMHASPTAVMSYGDDGGATAFLIGEENRGIEYMFIMMNAARLAVGMEGVGIAERAYQQARDFAKERVQSRAVSGGPEPVSIIHHPDVRRMLLAMRVQTEAIRAIAYRVAAAADKARRHSDANMKARAQGFVDLMTPVAKAFSTDTASEVADIGIQVHGGMGYIEETGAAQHARDIRVTRIYEGTNGIQANDLVGRKVARDEGRNAGALVVEIRGTLDDVKASDLADLAPALEQAVEALETATNWIVETFPGDPAIVAAGATHYLRLMGVVSGGWLLILGALRANRRRAAGDSDPFLEQKLVSARFFAEQYLPQAAALKATILQGGGTVTEVSPDAF